MTAAQSPAEAAILDPDAERAERHGRMFRELAEIGMELARDLRDQVKARSSSQPDPGLTFSRIARAVRLTAVLETRLAEEHKARERDDPVKREARWQAERAAKLAATPPADRRRHVLRNVVPNMIQAHAEAEALADADETELYDEAQSLIEDEIDDETVLNRPMPELIAVICKALDVEPDWSFWDPAHWPEGGLTEAEIAAGCPVERPMRLHFPPLEPSAANDTAAASPPDSAHPRASGDPGLFPP